jgi:gas vesicle protein
MISDEQHTEVIKDLKEEFDAKIKHLEDEIENIKSDIRFLERERNRNNNTYDY